MKKLLLVISVFVCFNSFGQTPMYKLLAKKASSCSYMLDTYTGAVAAYSLRQVDCDYAGNCIRVRRSSDNTESNIGFSGGNLDTASLKTFVGTGGTDDGFVVTWYDQSGSSNDVTQGTAANQPLIMDNGVVLRGAVLPIVRFDGSNDMLAKASFTGVDALSAMSIYIVVKQASLAINKVYVSKWYYSSQGSFAWQTGETNNDEMTAYTAGTITDVGSIFTSSTDANLTTAFYINNFVFDGSLSDGSRVAFYKNNTALSTSNAGTRPTALTTATSDFVIGQFTGALTRNFNGDFGEIIVFPSASSSGDRGGIFSNMNTAWQAY